MTKAKSDKSRDDLVREKISQRLVERIKAVGFSRWIRPWGLYINRAAKGELGTCPGLFPYSWDSGKMYSGLNILLLDPGYYITMRKANELGGHVRKGSKARMVVFTKKALFRLTKEEAEDVERFIGSPIGREGEREEMLTSRGVEKYVSDGSAWKKERQFLDYFHVFRVEDTEGCRGLGPEEIKAIYPPMKAENAEIRADGLIEAVLANYRDRNGIREYDEKTDTAYTDPLGREIHLPLMGLFDDTEGYYGTKLHEHVHSTMPLCRNVSSYLGHFGTRRYSREELVAELGSALLLETFGRLTDKEEAQAAAYLDGWNRHLGDDGALEKNLAKALIQANKAVQRILDDGDYKGQLAKRPCVSLVPVALQA